MRKTQRARSIYGGGRLRPRSANTDFRIQKSFLTSGRNYQLFHIVSNEWLIIGTKATYIDIINNWGFNSVKGYMIHRLLTVFL